MNILILLYKTKILKYNRLSLKSKIFTNLFIVGKKFSSPNFIILCDFLFFCSYPFFQFITKKQTNWIEINDIEKKGFNALMAEIYKIQFCFKWFFKLCFFVFVMVLFLSWVIGFEDSLSLNEFVEEFFSYLSIYAFIINIPKFIFSSSS